VQTVVSKETRAGCCGSSKSRAVVVVKYGTIIEMIIYIRAVPRPLGIVHIYNNIVKDQLARSPPPLSPSSLNSHPLLLSKDKVRG
jgi:hypothetical protein